MSARDDGQMPVRHDLPTRLYAEILRYLVDEGCDINHNVSAMTADLIAMADREAAQHVPNAIPDDESIESDIAGVVEDWFERGHDVFTTDEVCAAYVRGYEAGSIEAERLDYLLKAAQRLRVESATRISKIREQRDILRAAIARVRALPRYESDAIPEAYYIDGDSLDEALDGG